MLFSGGKLIYMFHICILLLFDIFSCVICNQMDIENLHQAYIYLACLNVYSYVLGSDLSLSTDIHKRYKNTNTMPDASVMNGVLGPVEFQMFYHIGHISYQFYTLFCVIWGRIYQKISFHRYI